MAKYTSQLNFITEQLDTAGYQWTGEHNFKIRRIVEQFFRDFDTHGLTDEEAQETLRLIYALGSTLSLAPDGYTLNRKIQWTSFVEGQNRIGEMCRIRLDAFDGPYEMLNGKVGAISGFTVNGQVRVFIKSFANSVTIDPDKVEVPVRARF